MKAIERLTVKFYQDLMGLGLYSGCGYLGASVFKICAPVHGAVYCAVFAATGRMVDLLTRPIFYALFDGTKAKNILELIRGVTCLSIDLAASAMITTAIGLPIAFKASLILSCTTIALTILFITPFAFLYAAEDFLDREEAKS